MWYSLIVRMLALLFFISCAQAAYFENPKAKADSDKIVRQCSLPVFIASDQNLTALRADMVGSAATHWNHSVGMDLFMDLGILDWASREPNDAFILVSVEETVEMKDKLCGITRFGWDQKGCMHFVSIHVNPKCLKKGNEIFETIVRHELGHVLGLTHVDDFTKLMNHSIEETLQHPVDVSQEEIERVKNLYMR